MKVCWLNKSASCLTGWTVEASSLRNLCTPSTATLNTNSSTSPATLSTLSTSGNYTAVGSGTNPCPGNTLAAGATCTFTVVFRPSINGTIKGAITITDNTSVSPQVYNLSGGAVLPLSFSPTSLTFAGQTVGTTSAPKTVTLTNNQNTSSTISFAASGQYSATPGGVTPCGTTLAAKAKCTLNVTFTPAAVGTIKGVVTLNYGGSFSPIEMKLTGTGQ